MPRHAELIYWELDDTYMITGIFRCEGRYYRVSGFTTTEIDKDEAGVPQ